MSLVDIIRPTAPIAGNADLPRRTHRMEDDAKKKRLNTIAAAAELARTSAAKVASTLPSRILELLARDQPLRRGELLERLECEPTALEHAINGLTRHDKVYGIRGEGYRLGTRPAGESQPSQENNMPKDSFEKIEQFLSANPHWFAPVDVAAKLNAPRAGTTSRLATLAKQKKIQATGVRRGLRYAALGVAKPEGEAASAPATKTRAKTKAPRRARTNGAGKAARARTAPQPHAEPRFGLFSDGSVHVETATCNGVLQADEAKQLVAFLKAK